MFVTLKSQALAGKSGNDIPFRIVREDHLASVTWAAVSWNPVLDNRRAPDGYRTSVRDITERKLAEAEREKLQARLIQAQEMESVGSLAGGITHDFNNLLFPIVGLFEMMLDDFAPGSPEHYDGRQIYKAGNRGRELMQQILSFSRQSEQHLIPVHIQKILKEVYKNSAAPPFQRISPLPGISKWTADRSWPTRPESTRLP